MAIKKGTGIAVDISDPSKLAPQQRAELAATGSVTATKAPAAKAPATRTPAAQAPVTSAPQRTQLDVQREQARSEQQVLAAEAEKQRQYEFDQKLAQSQEYERKTQELANLRRAQSATQVESMSSSLRASTASGGGAQFSARNQLAGAARAPLDTQLDIQRKSDSLASMQRQIVNQKLEQAVRQGKASSASQYQAQLAQIDQGFNLREQEKAAATKTREFVLSQDPSVIAGMGADALSSILEKDGMPGFMASGIIAQAQAFQEASAKGDEMKMQQAQASLDKSLKQANQIGQSDVENNVQALQRLFESGVINQEQFDSAVSNEVGASEKKDAQFKAIKSGEDVYAFNPITGELKKKTSGPSSYIPTGDIITGNFGGREVRLDSGAMASFASTNEMAKNLGLGELKIGAVDTSTTRNQADTIGAMASRFGVPFDRTNPNLAAEILRQSGHLVANVGESNHEKGLSVDIFPDHAYIAKVKPLLEENGWVQSASPNDKGHFDFIGIENKPEFNPKFKTQSQGTVWNYAGRTFDANNIMKQIEESSRGADGEIGIDDFRHSFLGFQIGGQYVPNQFKSENEQRYEQATRNFINAVLRRESGAVIADSEFANAEQQYFPQPGDTEGVIAQKRANRDLVINNFFAETGQSEDIISAAKQRIAAPMISQQRDPLGIGSKVAGDPLGLFQ